MKRSSKVVNGTRIRKYTVTSRDVLCDDGVTRDNVSLNNELAKPIGIVSATQTSMNKAPRVKVPASYCVSYKLDADGNKVNAKVFSPSNRKPNRRKMSEADKVEVAEKLAQGHRITAADLAPIFAD